MDSRAVNESRKYSLIAKQTFNPIPEQSELVPFVEVVTTGGDSKRRGHPWRTERVRDMLTRIDFYS